MEVKGKILAKKGDNKAFKLDDGNWYNLNDPVIPYLEKMNKGDEVLVTFEKKGVSRYVSKLTTGKVETPNTETKTSTTGFACEVCGAELKDGRFKKCFMCNKKGGTKTGTTGTSKTNYGSPEDIAGKQRGNALNAAGTAVSGNFPGVDPETIAQAVIIIADKLLEWARAEENKE